MFDLEMFQSQCSSSNYMEAINKNGVELCEDIQYLLATAFDDEFKLAHTKQLLRECETICICFVCVYVSVLNNDLN